MGFEGANDLESLGQDADVAIVSGNEEVVRPRANTAQIIALATSALKPDVLVQEVY